MTKKRITWIDFAKVIAILGVMADHMTPYGCGNLTTRVMSFYSVSLFVTVSGVTSYISYSANTGNILNKLSKQIARCLVPYAVASFILEAAIEDSFVLTEYLKHLVNFDAKAPYYYVLVYVNLCIIAPIIYTFVKKTEQANHWLLYQGLGLLFLYALAIWLNKFTSVASIYGGGGKLLGGSYILPFYIGLCFASYTKCHRKGSFRVLGVSASLFALIIAAFIEVKYMLIYEKIFLLGEGINPPGVILILYAFAWAAFIYNLDGYLQSASYRKVYGAFECISHIGEHTLYIFLYHIFILENVYASIRIRFGFAINNVLLKSVVYLFGMIAGSIVIEKILKTIGRYILYSYKETEIRES